MTRVFSRWFSSMRVALYRLVDGWSPLNWTGAHGARRPGARSPSPLLYLERDGKLYVVASFGDRS
jgi:hypothetical protein